MAGKKPRQYVLRRGALLYTAGKTGKESPSRAGSDSGGGGGHHSGGIGDRFVGESGA